MTRIIVIALALLVPFGGVAAQVNCINEYTDCADIVESATDTVRLVLDNAAPGDTLWVDLHFTIPHDTMSGFLALLQYDNRYLSPALLPPPPGYPEESLYVAYQLLGSLADLQIANPQYNLFWAQVSENPFDSGAIFAPFINQPVESLLTIAPVDEPLFRVAFIVDPLMPSDATTDLWFHQVNENILVNPDTQEYFCVDCRRTNLSVEAGPTSELLNPTTVGAIYTNTTVCCFGTRGDINGDGAPLVDIADLIDLVNFMFAGGSPPCFEAADVNADASLDIADLVYLVNFMFNSGPPPVACP
ncbi:dockerin type I repeat-containing protein [Patescibacteria group bacterium]|nr:dockerin type I repeat-containing protein [Patescibacteria group bacterium]